MCGPFVSVQTHTHTYTCPKKVAAKIEFAQKELKLHMLTHEASCTLT